MGRIVVTEYVSVDGVVEAPSGTEDFARVGWVDDFTRGPEGDEFKLDETMASDALLLGRATYDGFAPVWPHVEGEFADKFNAMPKYVVSSTLEDPEWNNTLVLTGDVVDSAVKSGGGSTGGLAFGSFTVGDVRRAEAAFTGSFDKVGGEGGSLGGLDPSYEAASERRTTDQGRRWETAWSSRSIENPR